MTALRPELPPPPPRIAALPVDHRGYPVPYFVAWVDGRPDHRIMDERKLRDAIRESRCWVCGQPLGRYQAYSIGPMCAVTRTNGEPPSHRDCALYAARACPFLTRPHARRRDVGKPEVKQPAGIGIMRNPGAVAVWVTTGRLQPRPVADGVLFDVPEPCEVLWLCEGRTATRAEVEASVESGLPLLFEHSETARVELDELVELARRWFPREVVDA